MLESELLRAIAQHPDDESAYLAFAEWLVREGGAAGAARASFIRTQLAREHVATETDADALRATEEELLDKWRAAWVGPLATLAKYVCRFRRGFLTSLLAETARAPSDQQKEFTLRPEVLDEALASDAARFLSDLRTTDLPKHPPSGLRSLRLSLANLESGLGSVRALRELRVDCLLASAALEHDQLETLVLPGDAATVQALRGARLPRLACLRLASLPADPELLARIADAAAGLGEVDIELAFESVGEPESALAIGPDIAAAFAPIAARIVALDVPAHTAGTPTHIPWELELPRLRRVGIRGAPTPETLAAPAWRTATELDIAPAWRSDTMDPLLPALRDSGIAARLRVLRIKAQYLTAPRLLADLSAETRFDALEELALLHPAFFDKDLYADVKAHAFPKLARLAVKENDLASLGSSELAPRVRSLRIDALAKTDTWRKVSHRFPHLESLSAETTVSTTYLSEASRDGFDRMPRLRSAVEGSAVRAEPDGALPPLPAFAEPVAGAHADGATEADRTRWRGMFRLGRLFHAGTAAVLPHRRGAPPKAFEDLRNALEKRSLTLDLATFVRLDEAARRTRIEEWRSEAKAAIAAKGSALDATLFELGARAQGAGWEFPQPDAARVDPIHSRAFVDESADLDERAKTELRELRGACTFIATARPRLRATRELRALHQRYNGMVDAPFAPASAEAKPPPPSFATATREWVIRRALEHRISELVSLRGDMGTWSGGFDEGSYDWGDGESRDVFIAWNADGVAAMAHDIYGPGKDDWKPLAELLGPMPEPLEPLGRALAEAQRDPSAAMWLTAQSRHRFPTNGDRRGGPLLNAFVTSKPFAELNEHVAIIQELVERALAGGGEVSDEELTVITAPWGSPLDDETMARLLGGLNRLGLRTPSGAS